ncbi:unnamed protein product [Cuscuta europaea]|uniref:Uncharacterized protein n=1 Tax=Cuscuta europaea TaxID=41803 RepID=A0A9P0YHV1_CUSEU|nr:unnamed protein product [Cuscuta europaea]
MHLQKLICKCTEFLEANSSYSENNGNLEFHIHAFHVLDFSSSFAHFRKLTWNSSTPPDLQLFGHHRIDMYSFKYGKSENNVFFAKIKYFQPCYYVCMLHLPAPYKEVLPRRRIS